MNLLANKIEKNQICCCYQNDELNFAKMYNFLEKDYQIDENLVKNFNIQIAFKDKIAKILSLKPLKFCRVKKFDINSNKIIFGYKNRKNLSQISLSDNSYKIAKFIKKFYENGKLDYNLELYFRDYAAKKIALTNKDCIVSCDKNLISIYKNGELKLTVLAIYKFFDEIVELKNEINFAFHIKFKNKIPNLYLIVPNQKNFKRHIEIKSCFKDISLKLVPYKLNKGLKC